MNWFRNLNASPKLTIGFGILLLLSGISSFYGMQNLGASNERLRVLYEDDMRGIEDADAITISRLSLGRQGRDAILNIDDPAIVAADEKIMLAEFVSIHSHLDAAEKLFYVAEGIAAIGAIRTALPAYEQAYHTLFQRVDAKDESGARAALLAVNAVGKPLYDGADTARGMKVKLSQQKFETSVLQFQEARSLMISLAAVSLLAGIFLSIFIARGFSVPLGHAVVALDRVAGGDLTAKLDVHTKDEVGRMASSLNTAVEKLRSTLREVAEGASNTNSASQRLAAAADAIASGAQEQAASLEQTSASLEQITAAVRQSADNAAQARQLANSSRESAEGGREVVVSAITAMGEINSASARISDIISTINEIAFQTNLLAVNAAVEAARAGEQGLGFAVVASEVRSLAQRSATAAKEIKGLIQDSLEKVGKGSELVDRSGSTLQGIVSSVKRVTDIVGEIAAAASEQSTGIEQVNTAVTQMDQVTQSNAGQTEELSSTAQSLASQATRLSELVGVFKLGDGVEFSSELRSHLPPSARVAANKGPRRASKNAVSVAAPRFSGSRTQLAPVGTAGRAHRDEDSFQEF